MRIGHRRRTYVMERLRRFIGGVPPRVQVAALPWRSGPDGIEVLLVTSRGTGRWVLPKGWPEDGETLWQAAAREAAEEAGVRGAVAQAEIGRFYYRKQLSRGRAWRCEVAVFPLEVAGLAESWPEEKKRRRHWHRARDAARLVDEPDLGELLAAFADQQAA